MPAAVASFSCTLALSVPNAVSSWKIDAVSNFCPVLAPKSFRKSNISCEKVSSVGEVRKKYLRPRCVSAGCEDFGIEEGNAGALGRLAGRRRHRREVGAEHRVHLLLRDQALGLAQADLGLALVIDHDHGDLGAAEPGKSLALGERQRQVGAVVDDLEHRLHRGHRIDADLRDRTRQRIEHADLDLLLRLGGRSTDHQRGARKHRNFRISLASLRSNA